MLRDRVKCAVANPGGPIGVGSVVTLGAAPVGFRSFLAAFGAAQPAYFVLSDGAGKALGGIWTVNGDGTATITAILINDATGGTGSETFASACTAWCALPAASLGGQLIARDSAASMRATINAVSRSGDVLDGALRVTASGAALIVDKPTGGTNVFLRGSTNNVARWDVVMGDSSTESGSNAGSDFRISCFSDAGSFLSTPLRIQRDTGDVIVASPAKWRSGIAAPPAPISAAGVGNWVAISVTGTGVSLFLPSGGTWAYFAWQSAAGSADQFNTADVKAGGSLVLGPSNGTLLGFCWRIA